MSYVLGLNCSGFLSSACLLDANGVRTAICEERLSRIKQDKSFPKRAIQYCLDSAGIELADLSRVCIGWHPRFYLARSDDMLQDAMRDRGKLAYLTLNELATMVDSLPTDMVQHLAWQDKSLEIRFVDHHHAHLANAYFQSGFRDTHFLILDGFGESTTGMVGTLREGRTEVLHSYPTPHSLGGFYSAFTDYCGFRPNLDEWKVMALSALGDSQRFYQTVRDLVRVDGLRFELDLGFFEHHMFYTPHHYSPKMVELFGTPLAPAAEPTQRHCDLVAAVQRVAEETVFSLLHSLHEQAPCQRLVVGGGFFMNSVCNGKLLANTPYENVYVGGSPDDSGISIGSAYLAAGQLGMLPQPTCVQQNYFGKTYRQEDVLAELARRKLPAQVVRSPAKTAASLLQQNQVIGWYQGGSEFGQRALGNRSILANPADPHGKDLVNRTIKYRESFRPFAPAVLQSRQNELFPDAAAQTSYFMERVFRFEDAWSKRLPAVVHFDHTGRLQTVSPDINPLFHELIVEFDRLTGIPAVLNTSFNTNGVPLVETPGDAINCFFDSGLDALLLGDYLLQKPSSQLEKP